MNAPANRPPWWEAIRIRPRDRHPVSWLRRLAEREIGSGGCGPTEVQLRSWQRRRGEVFDRLLEERLGYKLEVNVPPPGWTVEDDIREEALALSELATDFRTKEPVNDE